MTDSDALLERAREHCFMAGVGDVGEQLCAANMPYGIAKIQEAQRQMGLPPDATFVGAPDATVTRNVKRWTQGFGYGGRIAWTGDFVVLDIKSNGCGMLVGALPEVTDRDQLMANAQKLMDGEVECEGLPVVYDLDHGNHFLDVCETVEGGDAKAYFVMHSSGHEHRGSSPFGSGIYYDHDEDLKKRSRLIETPWGTLNVLEGEHAVWWHEIYMRIQNWNHARRAAMATALFGEQNDDESQGGWREVINATHQGLTTMNRAHLGCYVFEDEEVDNGTVFPLTISADLPVYLVKPKANFREDIAEREGFLDRAKKHGVVDRVLGANLLPHGGGYLYPQFEKVTGVIEHGPDDRKFTIRRPDGSTETILHPREAKYAYRGDEVLGCMERLELGEAVVTTNVRYVLRDKPMPGDA